jgi:hypothetical protein
MAWWLIKFILILYFIKLLIDLLHRLLVLLLGRPGFACPLCRNCVKVAHNVEVTPVPPLVETAARISVTGELTLKVFG